MSNAIPSIALPDTLSSLPVLAHTQNVATALRRGNVLLRAEPGAGKSTGLPLALLLSAEFDGKIILLEPRRLAARSVADRLASHLGEKIGQRVGLRMRGNTRVSENTRLEVVTEGVLTRLLQTDPGLDGVTLVIFDEFHERSLHADTGLALCLEVQRDLRHDLRLLLMSATLETDQLSEQLNIAEQFHCSVRTHPVQTIWMGDHSAPLETRVVRTVIKALEDQPGDVLVFLPGVAEINRSATLLQARLDPSVSLHRLHGGIGLADQMKATAPATELGRRVILATSLAETSITIEGVRVVVDSGLERRGRQDNSTGALRLETATASQASATQRAGRAGRTAPGICYRLWGEAGHTRRPSHWQPEIQRADLAQLLMELGLWGSSSAFDLPWLEQPPLANVSRAEELLTRLGLWADGQLTAHGREVAVLPVHPRLGHMLVWAARRGQIDLACQLAVRLDEQQRGSGKPDLESDLGGQLTSSMKRQLSQLQRSLKKTKVVYELPLASPAILLAQAYPDWIAQRRAGEPGRFLLACGAGAIMDEREALAHCPWIVVAQLGGAGPQARIFKAMALDMDELIHHSPELCVNTTHLDWDDRQQRVLAEHRKMIGSLVVDVQPVQAISDSDRASTLMVGIRRQGLECLPWTVACRTWQARVMRMRQLADKGLPEEWPPVDDDTLLETLDVWLLPWLQGIGSMKALQQVDLLKALTAMLEYKQQRLMDNWLPERYTVPSGSRIALKYATEGNPVLSVRLQEMLGCTDNPSIAEGRVPLKVELLSPAGRAVQVTEDLANFWSNSYPAVKKEMAGRYPKHVWPDDPLTAKPTSRAKPRPKT